jgi:hypothetical protein
MQSYSDHFHTSFQPEIQYCIDLLCTMHMVHILVLSILFNRLSEKPPKQQFTSFRFQVAGCLLFVK